MYACIDSRSDAAWSDQRISGTGEFPLYLGVGKTLTSVKLPEPIVHLGEETEPLNRVLERRVVGQVSNRLEHLLLLGHIATVLSQGASASILRKCRRSGNGPAPAQLSRKLCRLTARISCVADEPKPHRPEARR